MVGIAGVVIGAVAATLVTRFTGAGRGRAAHNGVAKLTVPLSQDTELTAGASVAISPDGTQIAYVATRGGVTELYRRLNWFEELNALVPAR